MVIREDGMVLTAYHVVEGASEIAVEFADGTTEPATMLGRDIGRDLAIVEVQRTGLAAIPLADPDDLRVGQTLIKLGYGAGQRGESSATLGVISAIHEPTRISPAQVQTDSAVNPGDSGSPLLTREGRIAGIVTSKIFSVAVEGVSFGSLIDDGPALVDRLIGGDTVCQPEPTLAKEATDPARVYRNNDWAWFVQLPRGYDHIDDDGYAIFYLGGEYTYPTDRRSRWPVDVIVYPPYTKSAYASARSLIDGVFDYWREDNGWAVSSFGGVREVCRGSEIAWEVDLLLTKPDSVPGAAAGDGWVERNRLMVVDGGSLWFLLRVAAWPERFDFRQNETDTFLYTFRFNREPLAP